MTEEWAKRFLTRTQIEKIKNILNENYKHDVNKIWVDDKPVSDYYPNDKTERVLGYEFIIHMEK